MEAQFSTQTRPFHHNPGVTVAHSRVFASRAFKRGEVVGHRAGLLRCAPLEGLRKDWRRPHLARLCVTETSVVYIDCGVYGNEFSFLRAGRGNLAEEIRDHRVALVATRAVRAGEELTLSPSRGAAAGVCPPLPGSTDARYPYTASAEALAARVRGSPRDDLRYYTTANVVYSPDKLAMEAQFAVQPQSPAEGVEKGARIGFYSGLLKCHDKDGRGDEIILKRDEGEDEMYFADLHDASGSFAFVDGLEYGNEFRYMNDPRGMHGVRSNAALVRDTSGGQLRIAVEATRDIGSGKELLIEYGDEYWARIGRNKL
eukprot:jgi/Mesvir1/10432/Mv12063-RA.1